MNPGLLCCRWSLVLQADSLLTELSGELSFGGERKLPQWLFTWKKWQLSLWENICFPGGSDSKESACNPGSIPGLSLIPGSGRSPGEGNGNPLQYSFLEDSMDIGAWRATVLGVTKSWTWLSELTLYLHCSTWMRITGTVKLLIYRGSFKCLGLVYWWFSLAETQGNLWDCCKIQHKYQVGRAKNWFGFSVQLTEPKIILQVLVNVQLGKTYYRFTYPWVSLLFSMSLSFGKLQIGQLNIPLLRAANWK